MISRNLRSSWNAKYRRNVQLFLVGRASCPFFLVRLAQLVLRGALMADHQNEGES